MRERSNRFRRRAGFTLIEILIVIVIIALLAALLLSAISGVVKKARQTRQYNEITQLGLALERFKDRYGIYPPSRIRLRENTQYMMNPGHNDFAMDSHSVKYLKKIWPEIDLELDFVTTGSTAPPATSVNPKFIWAADGSTSQVYDLEGDECLVFFLGGIAELLPDSSIKLHGFRQDPRDPSRIQRADDPASMERFAPLYDFDAGRLFARTNLDPVNPQIADAAPDPTLDFGITTSPRPTNKLASYRAVDSQMPYAYFSSYEGRGYRPHDMDIPGEQPVYFQLVWPIITSPDASPAVAHAYSLGPNPYTQTRAGPFSNGGDRPGTRNQGDPNGDYPFFPGDNDPNLDSAGAIAQAYEANGYQLISPGSDGLYGAGGRLPPVTGPMASFDIPAQDNIANIGGGKTIGQFSNELTK